MDKNAQRLRAQQFAQGSGQQTVIHTVPQQPVKKVAPKKVAPKPLSTVSDKLGNILRVGDIVLRAVIVGNSPALRQCKITKIEGTKVWLDGSNQALIYTDRLVKID